MTESQPQPSPGDNEESHVIPKRRSRGGHEKFTSLIRLSFPKERQDREDRQESPRESTDDSSLRYGEEGE